MVEVQCWSRRCWCWNPAGMWRRNSSVGVTHGLKVQRSELWRCNRILVMRIFGEEANKYGEVCTGGWCRCGGETEEMGVMNSRYGKVEKI